MVQDPRTRRGIPEKELRDRYPNTWKYLQRFEPLLRERAAFTRYFTRKEKDGRVVETSPFYSMFDVGDYTFAPWKVVWRYVASDFIVSVVGPVDGKPVQPKEKLMLVACESDVEAAFPCGVLSSTPLRVGVQAFFVETQIAPHVIERFRIPKYDPSDPGHRVLAEASRQAHAAVAQGDAARLAEIEARVNALAAELWGLTDRELASLRRELRAD